MTRFDDPSTWTRDYAPGLVIIKDRFAYWQAPKRYVKAGWDQPRHKLPDDPVERIALCRQYTRDLLNWWAYQQPASPDFGTWAYVIRRYRTEIGAYIQAECYKLLGGDTVYLREGIVVASTPHGFEISDKDFDNFYIMIRWRERKLPEFVAPIARSLRQSVD